MKFKLVLLLLSPNKLRHWWLSLLMWTALVAPVQALQLRVAIEQGISQIKVGSSTNAVVKDVAGKKLGKLAAMNGFYAQPSAGGKVTIEQMHSSALWIEPMGKGYVYINDRWYRGKTLVVHTAKGLTAVNYVDLEQYLYSVLGSEMNGKWPQEALKAQAVAARTYAIYKREHQRNAIYDLGDTQTSQVYKGLVSESTGTHTAVDATLGQVLTYSQQVILSVFHACSGGHTENVEDVWSNPLPYLRGVPDYDQNVTQCQWTKTFTPEEISQRISGVGNLVSLKPTLTTYGRIKTIKLIGDRGTKEVKGEILRNALGLKSTRFTITQDSSGLQFNGRGSGHGIGLSQWGAHMLALQGVKYNQILGHYYTGTKLAQMPGN